MSRMLLLLMLCSSWAMAADNAVDALVDQGKERTLENQQAQKAVDSLHSDALDRVKQYEDTLKIVEGLSVYNDMMQRQTDRQQLDMENFRQSINDVSVIERQVLPLLARMLDGLQEYILLDMPFLLEERQARLDKLTAMIERADVTVAEKTRRVFEAYQIETEYGRTIESYRAKLSLDNAVYDVDYLRIGRIALLYQVVGDGAMGYWNSEAQHWQTLEGSAYRRFFDNGLKIANQEMAPELISVPLVVSGAQL